MVYANTLFSLDVGLIVIWYFYTFKRGPKFVVRIPYVWFICFCTLFLYWGNNVSRKSLGQSLLEQECLFKHYCYVIQSDLLERSLVTLSTSKKQLMPKVQSEVTLSCIV